MRENLLVNVEEIGEGHGGSGLKGVDETQAGQYSVTMRNICLCLFDKCKHEDR